MLRRITQNGPKVQAIGTRHVMIILRIGGANGPWLTSENLSLAT